MPLPSRRHVPLAAAMQRAGVLVADTRPEDSVTAAVNQYLEVKKRALP